MKDYLQAHLGIALHLLGIVVAICAGAFVANHNQHNIETYIRDKAIVQNAYLLELATITDRNGADAIIENIVSDCPRRNEYESFLNSLGSLSKRDLITVQTLYESCGNFFAERKALMVSKLERELAWYQELIVLLEELDSNAPDRATFNSWQELVTLEKMRSTLLTEQSAIQEKIITLLISGSTAYSKDVGALVQDAQEIRDLLNVNDIKIDTLREGLGN
jgi:hypothetical protein